MNITKTIKILFVILSLFLQSLNAQQGVDENTEERTLGEHYFSLSNTLGTPFILTSLTLSLGLGGISDLQYSLPSIDGTETKYIEGDLSLMLFTFEYQHEVKDWLSINFGFGVNSRMGSDHVTFLKEGINYSSSFYIGWLMKILGYQNFALSTEVQVKNGLYSIISVENYIEDGGDRNEDASLISDKYSTSAAVNFNAAYGISRLLGLYGEIGFVYGESVEEIQNNEFYTNAGIGLDLDFTETINTPLSLILGYRFSSFSTNSSLLYVDQNIFFGQISYIGRADFMISLNFMLSNENTADESTIWPNTMEIYIKYLF